MAAPVDAARVQTRVSTSSGIHTVNLPSGIQAGDLLIWIQAWDGGPGAITYPAGWTRFDECYVGGLSLANHPGSAVGFNGFALYRYADGTEGSTVTADPTNSEASNSLVWRITGADPNVGPRIAARTAGTNAPNPPLIEPGWGPVDSLFLAGFGSDSGGSGLGGNPSGYGNVFGGTGAPESGGVGCRGCSRQATATETEDPGTGFTISSSVGTFAYTIAVKGVADLPITSSPFDVDAVSTATQASSLEVELPPELEVDDLLLMWLTLDGFGGNPGVTTPPSGWTLLGSEATGSGDSQMVCHLYMRKVTGSEGTSVTVGYSKSAGTNAIVTRIKGWNEIDPPEVAFSEGSSATADPPNLAPSWGAKPTLWLALAGVNAGTGSEVTGVPTNYERPRDVQSQQGAGASVCARKTSRYLEAASEDPGAYSNANTEWVAATVAVLAGPSGRSKARQRSTVIH